MARLSLTGLSILIVSSCLPALAQTSTTGSVSGQVLDRSGKPVAAARVQVTSSQLTRTAITDAAGRYAFGLLTPGSWKLAVDKEGYQSPSQTIQVGSNDSRTVNFRMGRAAEAVVEVTSTVSALDATTAQTGFSTSMETLASVPKSRDLTSLVLLAPGASSGGFDGERSPSVSGASAAENSYIVDGLTTTDFRTGFQGATLVPEFVDQVEIQTGGFKPEFSALGGVLNAVVKSGTNTFRGSTWVTYDPNSMAARKKDNAFFVGAEPESRADAGFEVSGPLIKDRLFYFIGFDHVDRRGQPALNKYPGLPISAQQTTENNLLAKINFYPSPDHQIYLTVQYDPNKVDTGARPADYGTGDWSNVSNSTTRTISLNYDWTISPHLFLSLKAGYTRLEHTDAPGDPNRVWVADNAYFTDLGPQPNPDLAGIPFNFGGYDNAAAAQDSSSTRQFRADLNWTPSPSHTLKFGYSYQKAQYTLINHYSGGYYLDVSTDAQSLYQSYYQDNGTVTAEYAAYYAQDTWEASPGLRIFYGARFETQKQLDPLGNTIMDFSSLKDYAQPRLGFTWDPAGNNRTKISGSYAVYFETMPQRLAMRTYAAEMQITYVFSAPKFSYDPGNPNHYGTVNGGLNPGNADQTINYGPLFTDNPIAKGIKLPQRKEYVLGFDQELGAGMTAGIHGKYRKLTNVIEDSVITDQAGNPLDPTGHAILWNPGPSVTYTTKASFDPSPATYTSSNTLYPVAYNQYKAIDITFRRQTARAELNASYTWSRLEGNYEGVVASSNQQADGNITASMDYWPYVGTGLLPLDRTHAFKAFGGYRLPAGPGDLNLGFNFLWQSGVPKSLFDDGSSTHGKAPGYDTMWNLNADGTLNGSLVSGPTQIAADPGNVANWTGGSVGAGTYTGPTYAGLDIGGYGSNQPAGYKVGQFGRTPSTTQLDLHADYDFPLGHGTRLVPGLDVFNAFNTRQAMDVFPQGTDGYGNANPGYGAPKGYQQGRYARFSLKLMF